MPERFMPLHTGVKRVICTCDKEMERVGGHFGGDHPTTDTYFCRSCRKHVVVVTPKREEQIEFDDRIAELGK